MVRSPDFMLNHARADGTNSMTSAMICNVAWINVRVGEPTNIPDMKSWKTMGIPIVKSIIKTHFATLLRFRETSKIREVNNATVKI